MESESMYGVCSVIEVITGDVLILDENHPEESRACLLPVDCASVSVCCEPNSVLVPMPVSPFLLSGCCLVV